MRHRHPRKRCGMQMQRSAARQCARHKRPAGFSVPHALVKLRSLIFVLFSRSYNARGSRCSIRLPISHLNSGSRLPILWSRPCSLLPLPLLTTDPRKGPESYNILGQPTSTRKLSFRAHCPPKESTAPFPGTTNICHLSIVDKSSCHFHSHITHNGCTSHPHQHIWSASWTPYHRPPGFIPATIDLYQADKLVSFCRCRDLRRTYSAC